MISALGYVTNPQGNKPMGNVIGFAIHHSVTQIPVAASEGQELEHVRTIDLYHVGLNYGGFGYHLAAFPSGRSYLCGQLNGQRAHVASRNHELIGIVAIGTFTESLPGPAQLNALRECIAFAAQTYTLLPVRGHNDWALPGQGTACAGQLNGFNWDLQPGPPAPALPTVEQAAHATHYLYTAFYTKNRQQLHPFDAGVIEKALQWWKGS